MTFVSHAQNFEDVRLWRAFKDVAAGRYLDIGTQDPVHDSVSLAFYERGWRGVHVEPTPAYATAMRAARPDEIVVEAAVSTVPGLMQFFEIPATGLSTGIRELAERHGGAGWPLKEITVPSVTLASLFNLMGDSPIHWLKIDVEGMEADVLKSWGDHPARPAALVIEATAPNTQIQTHLKWHDLVLSRGYREVLFDGLSRYFIHETFAERGEALALSPNVFDGFQVANSHFVAGMLETEREADRIQANAQHQAAVLAIHAQHEGEIAAIRTALEARITINEEAAAEAREAALAQQRENLSLMHECGRLQGELTVQIEAGAARLRDAEVLRCDYANRLADSEQALNTAQLAITELKGQTLELTAELERQRSLITWREGQLAQAARLLSTPPDSLAGWPRLVATILARLAGRQPAAVTASYAAKVEAWYSGTGLQSGFASDWTRPPFPITGPASESSSSPKGIEMLVDQGPITSVSRLLAPHDAEFIRTAYQAVLGRAPDPQGGAYYLERLRAGVHKLEILRQLRRSDEGRRFIPGVAGLDRAIKRHRRATLPIVGALVGLATGAEGNSATHRQLRALANDMACMRADQSSLTGVVQHLAERSQAISNSISSIPSQSSPIHVSSERMPPKLDVGSMSQALDSHERRLVSNLRLFARMHGAFA